MENALMQQPSHMCRYIDVYFYNIPDHQEPESVQQQVQAGALLGIPDHGLLPRVSRDPGTWHGDISLFIVLSPPRFLRGLEEMHVPKLLKEELGGGNKEFSLAEGGLARSTSSETLRPD